MPLDPRAKRLLDMLALGTNPAGAQDAAERRRGFAALMALARPPSPGTEIAEGCLALPHGALAVRCYAPGGTGDAVLPGLVFFHGGGLVAGSLDTHDGLCRMLAEAARCRLVSVDYRLAPEYPFPAAMEDAVAATRAVGLQAARLGIDPARLAVGGDSAGATLAILAATAARDDDGPRLAFQLLLCPVLDLAERRPSRHVFGQGYMLDQTTMDRDLADVLPEGLDPADPRVSPVRAPHVAGLPKTLIHTAEYDPLRDEGQVYAERLATAGVPVEHTCHPGMIHHFVGLTGLIPYAAVALADIGLAMQRAFAET